MSGQRSTPAPLRYRYLGKPGSDSHVEAARPGPQVPSLPRSNDIFGPVEIMVCDEMALLIAAARDVAWISHCNVMGLSYVERREALSRLRGALQAYDRERGAL